jgi:hypothetical protein
VVTPLHTCFFNTRRILNVAAVPFPRDGDESPELLAVLHGRLASSRNVLILAVGTGGQRRNSSNCLLAHVVCASGCVDLLRIA